MVLKFLNTVKTAAPLSMVLKPTAATVLSIAVLTYAAVRSLLGSRSLIELDACVLFPFCLSAEAGTAASLEESARFLSFHELSELMQALPGFLMLLTGEGKLLYLSDSVSEHLGHSMVSLHRLICGWLDVRALPRA